MPTLQVSPKVAARALGVSESSLKRWCDRGLLLVTKSGGGHRKVAVAELLRLARIQGRELAAPELLGLPARSTRVRRPNEGLSPKESLAGALLAGQEQSARKIIFDLLLTTFSLSELCDSVISAAFALIGDRWACREADVYQERRACEIMSRILGELRLQQAPPAPGTCAIGATIAGDHYSLASTMAELVLRGQGIQATSLGTSIPIDSCVHATAALRPAIFWLSVSHIADEETFLQEFARLSAACDESATALIVGGRALVTPLREQMVYAAHCDSMRQLERFAAAMGERPQRESPPLTGDVTNAFS